jgi:hypothetical protein
MSRTTNWLALGLYPPLIRRECCETCGYLNRHIFEIYLSLKRYLFTSDCIEINRHYSNYLRPLIWYGHQRDMLFRTEDKNDVLWNGGWECLSCYFVLSSFFFICHVLVKTSRLPVRCDDLQQYPRKLSTKKIQDFLLIVFTLHINFLIWLTDVIVYSMQYVLVQHD